MDIKHLAASSLLQIFYYSSLYNIIIDFGGWLFFGVWFAFTT